MEDKRVSTINKRLQDASSARGQYEPTWTELDKFYRGKQWEGVKAPPWIPRPQTNMIHYIVTTKRAAFAIENPVGELRAVSPLEIEEVAHLDKIYQAEFARLDLSRHFRTAIESGKLFGNGIVEALWEETEVRGGKGFRYEGDIRFRSVPISDFYIDPAAEEIEDARYIEVCEWKPIDFLKKHPRFGNFDADKVKEAQHPSSAGLFERGVIGKRDGMVRFRRHYEKLPLENGGFKYRLTYLVNDTIVHVIEELEPACYPFAAFYDYKQPGEFYAMSTASLILDNQKVINRVESVIAALGTLYQNPQRIVSRQSRIDPNFAAKHSSAPGAVFVADGDPRAAMAWQDAPQIPPALFNLAQRAQDNIKEITSVTDAYMGQSVGSIQTTGGVNTLVERATMRDRDQMFDVEKFIRDMSVILIKFITTKYTDERVARYFRENEDGQRVMDFIQYTGTAYRDVEFDVIVDVSAKAPITRATRAQEINDLFAKQYQYNIHPRFMTPKEYVQQTGLDNALKDMILSRMTNEEDENRIETMTGIAVQLSQLLAQGADMQTIQQTAGQMLEGADLESGMEGNPQLSPTQG